MSHLVLALSALLIAASLQSTGSAGQSDDAAEFVRLMNVGKATLENRSAAEAVVTFEAALALEPRSTAAVRNLARAYLMTGEDPATEKAAEVLTTAGRWAGESAATSYLTGLAYAHLARFDDAIPHFEHAVRLDPFTATLRFQLADALQAVERHDQAVRQLAETIRLDPMHASAHFRLASHARRKSDKPEFDRRMREFMRLRKLLGDETRTASALETCAYTRPEAARAAGDAGWEGRRDDGQPRPRVRFTNVSDAVFADGDDSAAAATVIGVDEQGRCELFVVSTEGRPAILRMSAAGRMERETIPVVLPPAATYVACIAGNYHDDVPDGVAWVHALHARTDVLLIGDTRAHLLKRRGRADFVDVTDASGLRGLAGRRVQWIDYEHDGDLDLIVAGPGGPRLWQNDGDGTFSDVTSMVGISDSGAATDVAAIDLEGDNAVDIVSAHGSEPTLVFENQRAGRFALMPEPPGPWPAAQRLLFDDLDNDGRPDAVLISGGASSLLYGGPDGRRRLDALPLDVAAAALIDFDNDGRLDLCFAGRQSDDPQRGAVRIRRNTGRRTWADVTDTTLPPALAMTPVRHVIAGDLDGDADSDLTLVTANGRLQVLRNDGGHLNGQLKILLRTMKTNPSGLGAQVEVRAGDFWVTRSVSRIPIEIGLGGRPTLDSVQTTWTNGIIDNQIGIAATPLPITITERNVAAGSCPFLYAWDGNRYRFVTDLLGNSPVGLSLRRDVMLPADPDEYVFVGDSDSTTPREGVYRLVITDEFRELLYLDQARLVAIDHAPNVEVHPTDKLMPPPFPPSDLWAMHSPRRVISAMGDDGVDRTDALQAIDAVFAPPGLPLPPPLRGVCAPLSLTLDFGTLDAARPLVLALTGWLQYGDASTNIAMSQNESLTVIPPTLEAETARGEWRPVNVVVGAPAGKTKTIVCDLADALPDGVRRLRLTTTSEIRWDRIVIAERSPAGATFRHEVPMTTADLRWRGFSELEFRAPRHPSTPDFDVVADRPPWRTAPQGWCTRYGDVRSLVGERDERLLIMNSGDALVLEFDADALPPRPEGLVRSFFLYSVGWDKDEDYNVVTGASVLPLPVEDTSTDWRLEYNSRWVPHDRFAPDR